MKTYKVDSERDSEVSEFLANKFQQKKGFDYNCHEQYKFKIKLLHWHCAVCINHVFKQHKHKGNWSNNS